MPRDVATIEAVVRRYVLSSHDGFGLGHTRRNSRIARAILAADPDAQVTLVTGLTTAPSWLDERRLRVVRVPPLIKSDDGTYVSPTGSTRDAVARRASTFTELVDRVRPDVVVVDRHPFGTFGELRRGLLRARLHGAALVLGLRDVLDDPTHAGAEIDGGTWVGVSEIFTDVLVYGSPVVCDHQLEYGLPVAPTYCGWVVDSPPTATIDHRRLVVAAGGGADGRAVFDLGRALVHHRSDWRATVLAGPYAPTDDARQSRVRYVRDPRDTMRHLAGAGGVIQMAGYNSTVEALATGLRPILVPRRAPRREQAVRALRLASLGLADVVDADSQTAEVAWLLDRPRRLAPDALATAGIRLDGAAQVARQLDLLARVVA